MGVERRIADVVLVGALVATVPLLAALLVWATSPNAPWLGAAAFLGVACAWCRMVERNAHERGERPVWDAFVDLGPIREAGCWLGIVTAVLSVELVVGELVAEPPDQLLAGAVLAGFACAGWVLVRRQVGAVRSAPGSSTT